MDTLAREAIDWIELGAVCLERVVGVDRLIRRRMHNTKDGACIATGTGPDPRMPTFGRQMHPDEASQGSLGDGHDAAPFEQVSL